MKTSNKLLFSLLAIIVLALIGVNLTLKKTMLNSDTNYKVPAASTSNQETKLKTDTILIDSTAIVVP